MSDYGRSKSMDKRLAAQGKPPEPPASEPPQGERMSDQVEKLKEAMKFPEKFTYCAYCGHTESVDVDGEVVAQHIRNCEKHPLAIELRQAASSHTELRAALQLAKTRLQICEGRFRGCNEGVGHQVSLAEIPAWIQEMDAALEAALSGAGSGK